MDNKKVQDTFDYKTAELAGLPVKYFEKNRENYFSNLSKRIPNLNLNSVIVLKGGDEIPRYDTDINHYHFCQESNFYYLTGVREPGLYAILDLQTSNAILFYDEPPENNKIWMNVVSKDQMSEKYKLEVVPKNDLNNFLQQRNMDIIYTLEGENEYTGTSVLTAGLEFKGDLSYLNSRIKHESMVYEVLCETRCIKTEFEKDLLIFIGKITNDAHMEIMKNIRPGLYERDLENVFVNYLSKNYYTRFWAYPCIGGCGNNAATLHYDINDKLIQDGDVFLADMGIRLCNYTSDVTITIPANGKFTKKQKEIYDIVLKSNREVIKIMKAGETTYPQMDKLSKMVILKELQALGLIKTEYSVDELYNKRIWKIFMPHGLGHYVGLDVHDVGSKVSYKSERILEEGNFITVEPGIYFIDFVLEKAFNDPEQSKYLNVELLKTYKGFGGVRIEDDVYVTADGVINFQDSLPRTTEEIESFMSKNNPYVNGTK
jgi:Xaa-Pro dipeptidase